jgi:hypothetical protein
MTSGGLMAVAVAIAATIILGGGLLWIAFLLNL